MSFRILGAALAVILGLVACSDESPPAAFSDIHFANGPKIRLDVAAVDIVSEFSPTFQAPQVEQNFPIPPQRAIENWVHDRLQANNPGSPYRVRVTIIDASARELEGGGRYTARASVKVDVVDAHGFAVRTAHAEAVRSVTVDPDASPDDRDYAWYGMTRDLIGSLAGELDHQIRSTFYPYVQ
ncbi:MAG TPA: hypothetical protein VKS60_23650 [Stellaceae bacterium]|nr:hypothetical protein [Stellaceae bacterium]